MQPDMILAKKTSTHNTSIFLLTFVVFPSLFFLLQADEKKEKHTAKLNYKHSINLLNALLRSRHHSHMWHSISSWERSLLEMYDKFAFLQFAFRRKHMEWWIFFAVVLRRARELNLWRRRKKRLHTYTFLKRLSCRFKKRWNFCSHSKGIRKVLIFLESSHVLPSWQSFFSFSFLLYNLTYHLWRRKQKFLNQPTI